MATIDARRYYAAHAPAMPDWFVQKHSDDKPTLPDGSDLQASDREQFGNMVKGILDPQDASLLALAEFRAYARAQAALRKWERISQQDTYFAWRWFYADQMLKTEPKETA